MDGGLSYVKHDCMDAGGRVTQERLPRKANQNDPTTKLNSKICESGKDRVGTMLGYPQGKLTGAHFLWFGFFCASKRNELAIKAKHQVQKIE